MIIVDECHQSIYDLCLQVLEYFDTHLIGLAAALSKRKFATKMTYRTRDGKPENLLQAF